MRRAWLYFVLAVLYLPFVPVVLNSVSPQRYITFPIKGLTLHWYLTIPRGYWVAFYNSLVLAALSTVAAVVLGTLAALSLERGLTQRWSAGLRGLFNLPIQIPNLVLGILLLQFYALVARASGIAMLGSFAGLAAAHIILTTPYVIAGVTSVLAQYDDDLDNAARTLGATNLRVLRRVTFPVLAPGIMAGLFNAFTMSFGNVPVSLFLIGHDYTTLPVLIFQDMQFDYQPGVLAISCIVMVFSFFVVWLGNRVIGFDRIVKASGGE